MTISKCEQRWNHLERDCRMKIVGPSGRTLERINIYRLDKAISLKRTQCGTWIPRSLWWFRSHWIIFRCKDWWTIPKVAEKSNKTWTMHGHRVWNYKAIDEKSGIYFCKTHAHEKEAKLLWIECWVWKRLARYSCVQFVGEGKRKINRYNKRVIWNQGRVLLLFDVSFVFIFS